MNNKLIFLFAIVSLLMIVTLATTTYQPVSREPNPTQPPPSLPAENIMDRFILKYPTGEFRGEPRLIYSDSKVTATWEPQANGGLCLSLYDTPTLEYIVRGERDDVGACTWYESLETDRYIIDVSDRGIRYYIKGSNRIEMVPNSSLEHYPNDVTNSETYYQYEDGPDRRADFSFVQSEKKLTVLIFQKNEPENGVSINTKLRTVDFILP